MTEPLDALVVPAIRGGDEAAFGQVFRYYYAPLCRYATGIVSEPEEAEEVVQQVFLRVWERRGELNITVTLKAYLYRAVHNGCINFVQRRKKNLRLDAAPLRVLHAAQDAGAVAGLKELEREVASALDTLPAECRRIFELSRFEELKYREIAELLGISVKTVENQVGKALRLMRGQLAHYLALFLLLPAGFTLLTLIFTL